jgi:hypothetical protein
VWGDGLTALAQTTFSSLGNTVNAEIAYFWSLAWFPIPLPPLPPLPFAATRVPSAAASKDAAAPAKPTVSSGTGHSARPQVAKQSTDTPATDAQSADTLTAATVTDTTSSASKTAKSNAADTTSGKSGSATSGSDAPKKRSAAGSARSHAPKADKAAAK